MHYVCCYRAMTDDGILHVMHVIAVVSDACPDVCPLEPWLQIHILELMIHRRLL
jgi:hypothetical protein